MTNRRALLSMLCAAAASPLSLWPSAARAQAARAKSLDNLPPELAGRLRFGWLGRTDVQEFIADVAHRHQMPVAWLEAQFRPLGAQPRALALVNPKPPDPSEPPRRRSWQRYLSNHVDQRQLTEGRIFLGQHLDTLTRVAKSTGIPVTVIAAIIGVETRFGSNTGKFPSLETLTTLAFESPRRAEFFRGELEALLLLGHQGHIDLANAQGSFAGALGIPQFMPSSWRNFAVSDSRNQKPDLLTNPRDAIASVGNFLQRHGWQPDQPTHAVAFIPEKLDPSPFVAPKLEPVHTVAALARAGIEQQAPRLTFGTKASLIDLPEADGTTIYWIAAKNFFVITQYNRSFMYAAAVLSLAEQLEQILRSPEPPMSFESLPTIFHKG